MCESLHWIYVVKLQQQRMFKGTVHPKVKSQSSSFDPHADGKLREVSSSTKHFWSFTAKECCSLTEVDVDLK